MKLIHCADIHLDSKLNANLSGEKAKERKREILNTFSNMVTYAKNNDVSGILISGDLFDTARISALSRNTVISLIENNPEILFFYLKGNHDDDNFLSSMEEIPSNLRLFTDEWKTYDLSDLIKIHGIELDDNNSMSAQISFTPDPLKINIVMLHGQEALSLSKDKAEIIDIKQFKNKGIDYLALGHIHSYKLETLDGGGVYCYPGCLEGRGFDETGDHGFVLLDIDENNKTVSHEFVSWASRHLYNVYADVTGLNNTPEMINVVKEALKASLATGRDLIKVILTGAVDVECEKDTDFIRHTFEDDYYFIKVYDETELKVDYEAFMLDESLKGEFVRGVMNSDLSNDDKAAVIRYGLNAISGGKLEI